MRTIITSDYFVNEILIQEISGKQNNYLSETVQSLESGFADLEKEAKLMQLIWGDNFQSDSLH